MSPPTTFNFLVDCICQMISSWSGYAMILMSGAIYIGIYIYVNAMVDDMKLDIVSDDSEIAHEPRQPLDPKRGWIILVRSIDFHTEIIG